MTTLFDAPMHDLSVDSNMDADMLPSASSDPDWLQVENMMDEGDAQKPLPEEVDMHSDVQEFEMRDAGEVDVDLSGDYDQMLPDTSEPLFTTEAQDQEIPDASRAPSPSPLASSLTQTFNVSIASNQPSLASTTEAESERGASPTLPRDQPTPHQDSKAVVVPLEHHIHLDEGQSLPGEDAEVPTADIQDNSTISGESIESSQLQQHGQTFEPSEYGDPTEHSVEVAHGEHAKESRNSSRLQGQAFEDHEYEQSVGNTAELNRVGQDDGFQSEGYRVSEGVVGDREFDPPTEAITQHQVTEVDEEALLMDPPPSVLLSYSFDNSRFALFNLSEDSRADYVSTPAAPGGPSTGDDRVESELNDEVSGKPPMPSASESHVQSDLPILLFHERFALYYEPLSFVFEAVRADESINMDGRFDHNIELVLSAPELDLTLPEDNIYSREISLHDLGVLHNGCDLSGPLSLRLDTISPRFGTRYKAIRDEIVRVVSQQEEDERQSRSDHEHTYLDAEPLHSSPEAHPPEVVLYEQTTDRAGPESGDALDEYQASSSLEDPPAENPKDTQDEQHLQQAEEPENQVEYEDSVGEYAAYDEYDEEQAGDSTEDAYGEADEDYPEAEEHVAAPGIEVANAQLDAVDDSIGHIYDPSASSTVETSVVGVEDERTRPSTVYVVQKERTNTEISASDAVANDVRHKLKSDAYEDTLSQEVPPAPALSDADSLLSEVTPGLGTRHPSMDSRQETDEVIAYEDAVDESPSLTIINGPPSTSATAERAMSTAPKRSYEEHEQEQLDGAEPPHNTLSESKRPRVD